MKIFSITILLISFIIQVSGQNTIPKYEVIKIDSTENAYIIDIKDKDDKLFRILSDKNINNIKKCKEIMENRHYRFTLYIFETIFVDGKKISTVVDDVVIWKEGDEFEICETDNLDGLCYCNKNK